MNEALTTSRLYKKYGKINALDGFTLSIPRGSITGLVGRNGAGKTTWMMTVAGFVRPDSGSVNIFGLGPFDALRHCGKVGIIPQDSELPSEAKVRELLINYGILQGLKRYEAAISADKLINAFNLRDKADSKIRALSHGMRKRVMIAQAFLGKVELVLLDEPLSGLDPVEADNMRKYIASMRGKVTIVISSHQLDDIERLCSHVAFIEKGKVEKMDTLHSITNLSGYVRYRLIRSPENISDLEGKLDGIHLLVDKDSLIAQFDKDYKIEDVNKAVLPLLLDFGVLEALPGLSLEAAYLKRNSTKKSLAV
jgi:ABC-type multidrug transport system ATPase subunit